MCRQVEAYGLLAGPVPLGVTGAAGDINGHSQMNEYEPHDEIALADLPEPLNWAVQQKVMTLDEAQQFRFDGSAGDC